MNTLLSSSRREEALAFAICDLRFTICQSEPPYGRVAQLSRSEGRVTRGPDFRYKSLGIQGLVQLAPPYHRGLTAWWTRPYVGRYCANST